jgi:hypothetical protein
VGVAGEMLVIAGVHDGCACTTSVTVGDCRFVGPSITYT